MMVYRIGVLAVVCIVGVYWTHDAALPQEYAMVEQLYESAYTVSTENTPLLPKPDYTASTQQYKQQLKYFQGNISAGYLLGNIKQPHTAMSLVQLLQTTFSVYEQNQIRANKEAFSKFQQLEHLSRMYRQHTKYPQGYTERPGDIEILVVESRTTETPTPLQRPHYGHLPGPIVQLAYNLPWGTFTFISERHRKHAPILVHLMQKTDPDELVFLLDADVLWGGCDVDIHAQFNKLVEEQRAEIFFGAEPNCWPNEAVCKFTPPVPEYVLDRSSILRNTSWIDRYVKFLNGGCTIGTVGALRKALVRLFVECDDGESDQLCWQALYLRYPNMIGLDYESKIFFNLERFYRQPVVEIMNDGVLWSPMFNRRHCFLHLPGVKKSVKLRIVSQLLTTVVLSHGNGNWPDGAHLQVNQCPLNSRRWWLANEEECNDYTLEAVSGHLANIGKLAALAGYARKQ